MSDEPVHADVHVLLVSAQAAPNLLPALALRPREAVLLVSAKMRDKAQSLARVLTDAGINSSQIQLHDEHDRASLQDAMLQLASDRDGQSLALNVTGGTKLMALAAQSIAITAGWQVYYVDADTGEMIGLHPDDWRFPLQDGTTLRQYLGAYGFRCEVSSANSFAHQPEVVQRLLLRIDELEEALGQLNILCQQARSTPGLKVNMNARQADSRALATLLDEMTHGGVLRSDGRQIVFAGQAQCQWANGGWLEQHVYSVVGHHKASLQLRDVSANLQVIDVNEVRNELDVAFMARNRLHVIECKTARMDSDDRPKANDSLFKLSEICRRVGGLTTRGLLASYRRLRPEELRLASALSIDVVSGAQLAQFGEQLRSWVGPR